jgi:hypothetical protein
VPRCMAYAWPLGVECPAHAFHSALLLQAQLVVANVGDSRAVLCRKGTAIDLSTEHRVWGKTPGVVAEIERIESVGGWVDDGRVCGVLAVSRCVQQCACLRLPSLPPLTRAGVAGRRHVGRCMPAANSTLVLLCACWLDCSASLLLAWLLPAGRLATWSSRVRRG